MLKELLVASLVGVSIFCAGCGEDKTATEKLEKAQAEQKAPSYTADQQAEDKARFEKMEADKKAEQEKAETANNAPAFTKEIITANVNATIPDAKNLTVSIARDNVFDVSFDLERPGMNEAQARSIAVKAIQNVIAANSGCQFEVIGVIVTSKMAPISMITFADGKYVSVVNGKREEFTP